MVPRPKSQCKLRWTVVLAWIPMGNSLYQERRTIYESLKDNNRTWKLQIRVFLCQTLLPDLNQNRLGPIGPANHHLKEPQSLWAPESPKSNGVAHLVSPALSICGLSLFLISLWEQKTSLSFKSLIIDWFSRVFPRQCEGLRIEDVFVCDKL